jgi:hypothetical protein
LVELEESYRLLPEMDRERELEEDELLLLWILIMAEDKLLRFIINEYLNNIEKKIIEDVNLRGWRPIFF